MKSKGFTLIELLVVIAIIGILSTLAIIALGSARQKARDSKRVADMTQVSRALELYYNDNNDYPAAITAGQPIASGSTVYMAAVPTNPSPRTDNGCANSDYTYAYITGTYAFGTCVGSSTGALGAGPAWITPQGLSSNRDGLVGFWKMNEGTGATTTADSSGNSNTGSLVSSPVWTASTGCKYSNCLVFSGTGDYVNIPSSSSVNVTGTAISFGGWIDFTSLNNNTVALDKANSYRLWTKSSGLSTCVVGTGSAWAPATADYATPATGWHHMFCTYDGSYTRLYLDGDLKASAATTITMAGNATALRLGIRSDGGGAEINTGLDNIRIYNTALSAAQVKGLYLNDGDN